MDSRMIIIWRPASTHHSGSNLSYCYHAICNLVWKGSYYLPRSYSWSYKTNALINVLQTLYITQNIDIQSNSFKYQYLFWNDHHNYLPIQSIKYLLMQTLCYVFHVAKLKFHNRKIIQSICMIIKIKWIYYQGWHLL